MFMFQVRLFVQRMRLVSWLKSTELLKIDAYNTGIYMKTECLQTIWTKASLSYLEEKSCVI